MDSDISRVIGGYYTVKDAAQYGEAIVLEMQENSGEDYTMVWTDAYDGSYPPGK